MMNYLKTLIFAKKLFPAQEHKHTVPLLHQGIVELNIDSALIIPAETYLSLIT